MKRSVLIFAILALVVWSGASQARLLRTTSAPKSVQAILYYPGAPSETVDLPVEFQVPQKDWQWSVKDGCLEYRIGNQDTTFCGTFKIVRTFE
jgi:hypothetical protein